MTQEALWYWEASLHWSRTRVVLERAAVVSREQGGAAQGPTGVCKKWAGRQAMHSDGRRCKACLTERRGHEQEIVRVFFGGR